MKTLDKYNPYKHIEPSVKDPEWLRISADIGRSDAFTLYGVLMDRGALRIAVGMFIKHLVNECRKNNWTIGADSRDKLVEYIVGLTTRESNRTRSDDSNRRRVGAVRARNPRTANVPTTDSGEPTTPNSIE